MNTRPANNQRRGQTLILALAILFLLITLGGIFITLLIRNLQRVTRQSQTDESLTLALAGLQYAAQQFKSSAEGADWRPETTEVLWRNPIPTAAQVPLRAADPDAQWLDPNSNGGFPFVRVSTGRGRFLVRVRYIPSFRPASAASTVPDEFDVNSKMIHLEVYGRPGEVDSNDPTFFQNDPTRHSTLFRKLEAYVPIGLVDQLWWITNHTNERGPAKLGVPAIRNPAYDPNVPIGPNNQDFVQHRSLISGGIRSNTDLQFLGTNNIRIYPARGEAIEVSGEITTPTQPNSAGPGDVYALEDTGQAAPPNTYPGDDQDDGILNDSILLQFPLVGSTAPTFTTGQMLNTGGDTRYLVTDERHRRGDQFAGERSAREMTVPSLNRLDAASGVSHYRALTRESGVTLTVPNGTGFRNINTGYYGHVDQALDPRVRAQGFYLPNFDDIQYPDNREGVRDEWLGRVKNDPSWFLGRYTPSVRTTNAAQVRPIAEVVLTENAAGVPKIRVTITHPDRAQYNIPNTAAGEPAYFYDLVWNAGTPTQGVLGNPQTTREFDYPSNGVFFAEGSIRVRGRIGSGAAGGGRQLTIVSGGTIYIEGNLRKAQPTSFLALMAQDYVTLNPTAFTRVQLNGDWLPNPAGDGVIMQQNSDLDVLVDDADGLTSAYLHLRQSAMMENTDSETKLHLFLPSNLPDWPNWQSDRFDFGANQPGTWPAAIQPPSPPEPNWGTTPNQFFYWFHQVSAGSPLNWAESNYQTNLNPNAPNYERKTVYLPAVQNTAGFSKFRLHVGNEDPLAPNQQAYLLSRVSVVPVDRPLRTRIEAMIYAFNGSWFVIPPPFFNQDGDDTGPDSRGRFFTAPNLRAAKTFPNAGGNHPFYNEPLNVEVELLGAINENFPAEPADTAMWTSRMWSFDANYNQTTWPIPAVRPVFRPDMHYSYDHNFRRMIRVRKVRTGQEEVVWTAPGIPPGGIRTLGSFMAEALGPDPVLGNSYVETLPVLAHLPASAVVYEGNPF